MTEPVISHGESIKAGGGSLVVEVWSHGAMGGPPLHIHHHDDEAWHVLEGTLWFRFAGRTEQAPAGTTVFVPAGVAHTFGSEGQVRYLIMTTPRVRDLITALHEPGADNSTYRRFDSDVVE